MESGVDLKIIVAITLTLFVVTVGVSVPPLRIILGLFSVLFIPGYVFVCALFPRRQSLDGIERVALSLGLSLALVPLLGIIVSLTPWGIQLNSIVSSLGLWTVVFTVFAWRQRQHLVGDERFEIEWQPIKQWLRKPRPLRETVISTVLTLVAVVAVGVLIWKIQDPSQGEEFTEFYILGPELKIQDYITSFDLNMPEDYNLGIVNHENRIESYSVRAYLDGVEVGSVGQLLLENEEMWEGQIQITPVNSGTQQILEFRLFRNASAEEFQNLRLFVDVFEP